MCPSTACRECGTTTVLIGAAIIALAVGALVWVFVFTRRSEKSSGVVEKDDNEDVNEDDDEEDDNEGVNEGVDDDVEEGGLGALCDVNGGCPAPLVCQLENPLKS